MLATSIGKEGKPNIITLAWTAILSASPFLVGIAVSPRRHSHKLISETKEFVLNLPSAGLEEQVMLCGTVSGRDTDKLKRAGLTAEKSEKVSVPRIKECYAWLECKVVNSFVTGDHTLFVGEVVATGRKPGKFGLYDLGGKFAEINR